LCLKKLQQSFISITYLALLIQLFKVHQNTFSILVLKLCSIFTSKTLIFFWNYIYIVKTMKVEWGIYHIQAALVICGLFICEFTYMRLKNGLFFWNLSSNLQWLLVFLYANSLYSSIFLESLSLAFNEVHLYWQ